MCHRPRSTMLRRQKHQAPDSRMGRRVELLLRQHGRDAGRSAKGTAPRHQLLGPRSFKGSQSKQNPRAGK